MRLRLGCRFDYEADGPAPSVVLVQPSPESPALVLRESWTSDPLAPAPEHVDLYGNRCRRLVVPAGASHFIYDCLVDAPPEPERQAGPDDAQHPIEVLLDPILHWLLPSRYCESDVLADEAWRLFGATPPGAARVQAVCDWIHANIEYGVASVVTTSTIEVLHRRGGMCRDLAHLGVTFCRALGIPSRYAFGYLPDVGIPGPYPPMDFHAWFEVWLGGRWWTYDARFNVPRIGRVPIGRGRDAADVAMVTTYGSATLLGMTVWADEVEDAGADEARAAEVARGG